MTITEFLLARFAEDEEKARNLLGVLEEWHETHAWAAFQFWLPSQRRLIADCEAKRQIVQDCAPGYGAGDYYAGKDSLHAEVLMRLALPYAGHPDYRQEWRP